MARIITEGDIALELDNEREFIELSGALSAIDSEIESLRIDLHYAEDWFDGEFISNEISSLQREQNAVLDRIVML